MSSEYADKLAKLSFRRVGSKLGAGLHCCDGLVSEPALSEDPGDFAEQVILLPLLGKFQGCRDGEV